MIWVVESGVFDASYEKRMAAATSAVGHGLVQWDDGWWDAGLPKLDNHGVVPRQPRERTGDPISGAGLEPRGFLRDQRIQLLRLVSPSAKWLLQRRYTILPDAQLVADPRRAFDCVGADSEAFIRPDSPLKPFVGRVLARNAISLSALDHGFYYDDEQLPVVVAPTRTVGQEWRFVVVDQQVVAGSGYLANGRKAVSQAPDSETWRFAAKVALEMEPPEAVCTRRLRHDRGALPAGAESFQRGGPLRLRPEHRCQQVRGSRQMTHSRRRDRWASRIRTVSASIYLRVHGDGTSTSKPEDRPTSNS